MGIQPIVFCRERSKYEKKLTPAWIPDMRKIPVEFFPRSRRLAYLFPAFSYKIGLKKFFKKYKCDLVHAHNLPAAYYSYKQDLPTVFDDWEYHLEYFDYHGLINPEKRGPGRVAAQFLYFFRRKRAKKLVLELIRNLPVIVTNEEVEKRYRELGATSIWWVPNVPLSYEREYAFAVDAKKRDRITTCYIGNMTVDSKTKLRNTSGIRELWKKKDLGDLIVFEGKNYLPHLEVLRKVRECHFNLLYWKPLPVHRYYLQNKAFLASVVGVPTIISSSLKATINLLGEYALPVNSLEEIPKVIESYKPKEYQLNPAHIWEYYQPKIRAAYENAMRT